MRMMPIKAVLMSIWQRLHKNSLQRIVVGRKKRVREIVICLISGKRVLGRTCTGSSLGSFGKRKKRERKIKRTACSISALGKRVFGKKGERKPEIKVMSYFGHKTGKAFIFLKINALQN
jgi:hypothetical protein